SARPVGVARGQVNGLRRGRSMTRWNAGLTAVAVLVAGLAGCRQQCFMTEADYQSTRNGIYLPPPNLEVDLHASIVPSPGNTPPPMTVRDLNRPVRYLSLPEAVAIALE